MAYSCQDTELEDTKREEKEGAKEGKKFLDGRQTKEKERILSKKPTTIFQYLVYAYFESLDLSTEGALLHRTIQCVEAPTVSKVAMAKVS